MTRIPAFRKDGTLLGVAGISIYRHMAKDNLDEIRSIVVQQQAGRQFDARTHVELDPANYTLQVSKLKLIRQSSMVRASAGPLDTGLGHLRI